jgi:hypothetical protein
MADGVRVISDAEALESAYLVCMPWSSPAAFEDDVRAECVDCGVAVRVRPHALVGPKRICFRCAMLNKDIVSALKSEGIGVTSATMEEVKKVKKKRAS